MADAVGSLRVDLLLNQAEFLAGMKQAGSAATRAGREISDSFTKLGALETVALAPLNALGAQFGVFATLAAKSMGTAIGAVAALPKALEKAQGSFGKFGAVLGLAGKGVIGIGIAGVAAGAGIITLALHTAESAAKMYALSQSTGVSVETLSGFAFVAKQSGVSAEAMNTSLERMNRSAFAAATAPHGATNAYTRLTIAVRDANGALLPTQEIFKSIADKFAAMADGPAKGALAIQLFGKSGADVIPILNQGRAGIDQYMATAQKLGIVLSTQTAEAADKFEQSLNEITAAGEGLSLNLLRALLPSLQAIASMVTRLSQSTEFQQWAETAVTWMSNIAKGALLMGDLTVLTFRELIDVFQVTVRELAAVGDAMTGVAEITAGDLVDGVARLKKSWDQASGGATKYYADAKGAASDSAKFAADLIRPPFQGTTGPQRPRGGGDADTSAAKSRINVIAETIARLKDEAAAEAELARAVGGTTASIILATAAEKANEEIARLQISAKNGGRSVTEAQKQQIRDLITLTEAYKAGFEDNKGLDEFIRKTQQETAALDALAKAHGLGPAAYATAQGGAPLEKYRQEAGDLTELIAKLKLYGATSSALAPLVNELDQLNLKMGVAAAAEKQLEAGKLTKDFNEEIDKVSAETKALNDNTLALVRGGDARRQLAITQKVNEWAAEPAHKGATPNQLAGIRAGVTQESDAQQLAGAGESVASFSRVPAIQAEIDVLSKLRSAELAAGQSTISTDALIASKEAELATARAQQSQQYIQNIIAIQQANFDMANSELLNEARLHDSQRTLIEDWDRAALEVGTFGDKVRAVLNEIQLEGQNAAANIAQAFKTALDGVNDEIAKMLTGQKFNFGQIATQLGQSLVKSGLQSAEGSLTTALFGSAVKTGQLGSSAGNPMFVSMVNSTGLSTPGSTSSTGILGSLIPGLGGSSGSSGISGLLGGVLGKFGIGAPGGGGTSSSSALGTQGNPMYVISASGAGGGLGGIQLPGLSGAGGDSGGSFSDAISAAFGGGLADGGDMTPGKAYLVGEDHPEILFAGRSGGSVSPSLKMGGGTTVNQTNHYHGVSDADSFRRSEAQTAASHARDTSIALKRNGR
jgi:hypothetical protein